MRDFAQSTYLNEYAAEGQWIQIFPSGQWYGHDGRGPYRLSNPQKVIANSKREKTDLVIDRDHERFHNPKAVVVASGWFKEFEVRNGEIWGFVEWTPSAQKSLQDKEFRYFSPEYIVNPDTREMLAITGGSLTNKPNFELDAVASMQHTSIHKEIKMDEHLKKLALLLGLTEAASTEDLLKASSAKFGEGEKLEAQVASLTKKLDIKTIDDADGKISTLIEAASKQAPETGSPDPTKYVPIEALQEVASQLKDVQKTLNDDKATLAVEAAMKDGKISPAMKNWAMSLAEADIASFNSYVEAAPQIVSDKAQASDAEPNSQSKLTSEEHEVASQLGLTEEQMLGKTEKEEDKKAA